MGCGFEWFGGETSYSMTSGWRGAAAAPLKPRTQHPRPTAVDRGNLHSLSQINIVSMTVPITHPIPVPMFSTTAEYPIPSSVNELDLSDHVTLHEPMMRWDALVVLIGTVALSYLA